MRKTPEEVCLKIFYCLQTSRRAAFARSSRFFETKSVQSGFLFKSSQVGGRTVFSCSLSEPGDYAPPSRTHKGNRAVLIALSQVGGFEGFTNHQNLEIFDMINEALKGDTDMNKTAEALTQIGEALYGQQWKTELARSIGHADARLMRFYANGTRVMPDADWLAVQNEVPKRLALLESLHKQMGATE